MNQRTCIVTRESSERSQLLKFVIGPDNKLYFDLEENLPGRGIWVKNSYQIVKKAIEKGSFKKFAVQDIAADDLLNLIEEKLKSKTLSLLSLANKSGNLLCGFDKLNTSKTKYKFIAELKASDSNAKFVLNCNIKVNSFSSDELSNAIGKTNVVHVGVIDSGIGKKFHYFYEKYKSYKIT